MGREVAKKLAEKGANLILVARDKQKLEDAKKYVAAAAKDPSKQRFTWISADATELEENERLVKEATEWNDGKLPDIVWQIAGGAHPDLFLDTPLEIQRKQMDLNYWSACYLAHTVLRLWTEEKQAASDKTADTALKVTEPPPRHFIMTASLVVYVGIAGYLPYSPAKAAMRQLADGLKSEINLYNGARYHNLPSGATPKQPEIKISLTAPGTILSPGFEIEEQSKHPVTRILEEGDPRQLPDAVAEAMIKGLEKGNFMTTTHFLGHAMRVSALGGAPRNGLFGIRDALFSWATAIAWLFIGPDMEKKVWKFGKEHGVQHREARANQ
jgi:3-dehydrosphinganine reductase